ncbi:MAG: hypothetical protein CVU43_18845 [Chloroflexi bacterium HGW-Chloroflexi-5]|nr:MAG: hypothetical protein CVU43_18845 [Chloroflexi bacterium HGW-Chloroflexi-5]
MDYLKHEEFFLEEAWAVYESYFLNKSDFIVKYNEINSLENKSEFLRVISRYHYLVKDLTYSSLKSHGLELDFVSATHKFITIIALIESLYHEAKHIDFYEWLMRGNTFPLSKEELKKEYKKYKDEFGSRKSIIHFFSSLDSDIITYIQESITLLNFKNASLNDKSSIEQLSNLLYQIRSDFIHNAELVVELSDVSTIAKRNEKPYLFELSLLSFCKIFELGVLKFFNIKPDKNSTLLDYRGFTLLQE